MMIKYHESVPQDIKSITEEFIYSKRLWEAQDGVAYPISPLLLELVQKGYWCKIHVYGYEVIPLNLFIEQELKEYPEYREIMLKALRNNGLTDDSIKKFAPNLLNP